MLEKIINNVLKIIRGEEKNRRLQHILIIIINAAFLAVAYIITLSFLKTFGLYMVSMREIFGGLDLSTWEIKDKLIFLSVLIYVSLSITAAMFNIIYKLAAMSTWQQKEYDYLRLKEKYGAKK